MEKVLVLNADYTPLNVTTLVKGFGLVYRGKAEVLKKSENPINSGFSTYVRPLVIRLLNYVRYRSKSVKISRSRLYRRDNYECAYCGQKKEFNNRPYYSKISWRSKYLGKFGNLLFSL